MLKNLSLYKKHLGVNSVEEVMKEFLDTLLESNATFSYFCDWDKIKKNVAKYSYEINILNYLVGASNVEIKLREILKKNPEVIVAIPLIIAVRDLDIAVIKDPKKPMESLTNYSFNKKALSDADIEEIVSFCRYSGILSLFSDFKIKDLRDYLVGVETGLDTNARKNRSGTAMELLIAPILEKIKGIDVYPQKNFKSMIGKAGIPACIPMKDRKFDYVIKTPKQCYNVEVNYYSGTGSKPQEIVDSYINRNNELRKVGWGFIWITDGAGCWKNQINQLTKAFNEIDYVLNISFAKSGLLEAILK
jgi:type II restriction enzyme